MTILNKSGTDLGSFADVPQCVQSRHTSWGVIVIFISRRFFECTVLSVLWASFFITLQSGRMVLSTKLPTRPWLVLLVRSGVHAFSLGCLHVFETLCQCCNCGTLNR